MVSWRILNFFDANSSTIEQIIFFHDHRIIILFIIVIIISYIILNILINNNFCLFISENQSIEIIWTILPIIILIFIALPSLQILYLMEENFKSIFNVKIIGHQWYWSYELRNFNKSFDSFLIPSDELNLKDYRLLEVDNRLIIPNNFNIRILLSSTDVIHAWTIQRIGIKIDAIPGRLNQINFYSNRCGLFSGQCSEICGANHRFIPIQLEILPLFNFIKTLYLYSLKKVIIF